MKNISGKQMCPHTRMYPAGYADDDESFVDIVEIRGDFWCYGKIHCLVEECFNDDRPLCHHQL